MAAEIQADPVEQGDFGHHDLTLLSDVNQQSIVNNLKLRFKTMKPYTFAGEVVVSINPYQPTHAKQEDSVKEYQEKEVFDRPPHVYGAVDMAYLDMKRTSGDSFIVFNGICGSGKTEASKMAMHYIANLTEEGRRNVKVQNLLLNSSVVLESFGNAQTVWNNNSSRFGKLVQVMFNFRHVPEGGCVKTSALETLRVVSHRCDERNFHYFYQLLAGSNDGILNKLKLERDQCQYYYLDKEREAINTAREEDDKRSYEAVCNAMKQLNFSDEEQSEIRRIAGAILHLGNVELETVENNHKFTEVEKVASLLGTNTESIVKFFSTGLTMSNEESVKATLFHACRDELAKFLYSRLFDYVVSLINQEVAVDILSKIESRTTSINLLDFPGFETYSDSSNSFEQLCANYCCERLHQVFVTHTLKQKQDEYTCERLQWMHVEYADNESTCTIVDHNDKGILAMMDAYPILENGFKQSLLQRMDVDFANNEKYSSCNSCSEAEHDKSGEEKFQVHHFIETVTYDLTTFPLAKFKRLDDMLELLSSSDLHMLKKKTSKLEVKQQASNGKELEDNSVANATVKHNICELLEQVRMESLHYVCCLLPNAHKSSTEFDDQLVLKQICAHCLVELTKIQQKGYYSCMTYNSFVRRYKFLLLGTDVKLKDKDKDFAHKLIKFYHLSDKSENLVEFGHSKIFLRTPKTVNFLEELREENKPQVAIVLQRWVRTCQKRARMRKKQAISKIIYWFRRCHAKTWFYRVLAVFDKCSTRSDLGMHLQWPQPPVTLDNAYVLLKKIQRNWWAKILVSGLKPSEQETVRLKTIALTLLAEKKVNWLYSNRWLGDELQNKEYNPKYQDYMKKMTSYQENHGDASSRRLYSCYVTKLNRKQKPDPRVLVLSEQYLYRLDTNFKMKKRHCIDVGQIVSLSVSPGNDQALVVHCVPKVGDCVLYLENNRPVSEMVAAIWNCYYSKYNKCLPVAITPEIEYRPHGAGRRTSRTLACDPGSPISQD